jgi:hypothetical protein
VPRPQLDLAMRQRPPTTTSVFPGLHGDSCNLCIMECGIYLQVPLPVHSFVIAPKSSEAPSPTSQCDRLSGDISFLLSISDGVGRRWPWSEYIENYRQASVHVNLRLTSLRIHSSILSGKFYSRFAWLISGLCGRVLRSM